MLEQQPEALQELMQVQVHLQPELHGTTGQSCQDQQDEVQPLQADYEQQLAECRRKRAKYERQQAQFEQEQAEFLRRQLEFRQKHTKLQQQLQVEIQQQQERSKRQRLALEEEFKTLQQSQQHFQQELQSLKQALQGHLATLQERLAASLPAVRVEEAYPSNGRTLFYPANMYMLPRSVRLWENVTPDEPTSGSLTAAVISFQTAPPFQGKLGAKVPSSLPTMCLRNEVDVGDAWSLLLHSADTVALPPSACWQTEAEDDLKQSSVSLHLPVALNVTAQLPEAAIGTSNSLVFSISPQTNQAECQGANSAAYMQQSAGARRAVCLGKFMPAHRLCDDSYEALDLVKLCQAPLSQDGTVSDEVLSVHQLYTHMATNCILFGFISSWRYTCLARLVPQQMEQWPWHGDLHLSLPIGDTNCHTPQQQCMTAIGGVSWLHDQAIQVGSTLTLPSHRLMLPHPQSPPRADTAERPARPSKDSQARHIMLPAQGSQVSSSCGGARERYSVDIPSAELTDSVAVVVSIAPQAAAGNKQADSLSTPRLLRLDQQLCDGCYGRVFHGMCDAVPAVIKLLGPSREGLAAMEREQNALCCLAAAKLQAASQLLGVGHLHLGVHFLATARIVGVPLSEVQPLSEEVAAAAVRALAQVHAAHPRLLHGDVRLQNIMLVTPNMQPSGVVPASCSAALSITPVCKVIDFGAAAFNGSPAAQQEERDHLQRLLQDRSKQQLNLHSA